MKTRIRLFLCVVLLLALCTTLTGLSAAADYTYTLSTGETCEEMIVFQFFRDIIDANFEQAQGDFAPGLKYDFDNTFLYVSGTPTTPGTYTIRGKAITEDDSGEKYELTIIVQGANDDSGVEIPVVSQQPALAPVLTKSPTDESVYQGASAMFIARADEADRIDWYLVEPESYSAYTLQEAASYINGLTYSGAGTEVLELYNIPLEMDGWKVECLFTNSFGTVMSESATISVSELKLVNPSIKTQPQNAQKDMDSSVILSVIADNNTEGSTLKYQWYMSATGSGNLNPISGANASSYTPPKTEGTVYYTVAVWSNIDGKDSGKTYSTPAAVTFSKATAVSPSPSPSLAPSAAPSVSPSPMATVQPNRDNDEGGFSVLGILVIALILSAVLAVAIIVILKKNSKSHSNDAEYAMPFIERLMAEDKNEEEEEILQPVQPAQQRSPKEWLCACGALNNSPFCTQCGRAKPELKACAKCGWMPESINKIPHFCPECGTAFEDELE